MPVTDDLELRPVGEHELLAWARAVTHHFHEDRSDEELERFRSVIELDRTLAVFDRERIVGNLGVHSFTCTVPHADPLACAGVTAVGVAATHRRRGLLTRMMTRCLSDAAGRGEPMAALYASESPIYGRYGFGAAAVSWSYRLDRPWFELARPAADLDLIETVEPDAAITQWPAILEAVRAARPGMMSRSPAMWRSWLGDDAERDRNGATRRRLVHVPERGYAAFRLKDEWSNGVPDGTLRLEELVAADAEAEAALWQFLFGVDLMMHLHAPLRPADDALPHAIVDRGRLRIAEPEPLYLRLLDVPAALTARGYAVADSLVLDVHDPLRPDNSGRWRLVAGPDGAACDPTGDLADLELDVADLASVYLGGVPATALVAARRVGQPTPGAAARADRLLTTDAAPWNPFIF